MGSSPLSCWFLGDREALFSKISFCLTGDFVVISPIKEGNKVQAEIVYVLYQKQIKYLQEQKLWLVSFLLFIMFLSIILLIAEDSK